MHIFIYLNGNITIYRDSELDDKSEVGTSSLKIPRDVINYQ